MERFFLLMVGGLPPDTLYMGLRTERVFFDAGSEGSCTKNTLFYNRAGRSLVESMK